MLYIAAMLALCSIPFLVAWFLYRERPDDSIETMSDARLRDLVKTTNDDRALWEAVRRGLMDP